MMQMGTTKKKVFKIIVAGDGGIGKTTLLKRFCYHEYCDEQKLTVGTDVFMKKFQVNVNSNGENYLQLWDMGGQEHFRFLLGGLIKGAQGAILAFDIRRRKSFIDLKEWLGLLRRSEPNMPIILVATKKDLGYHPTLRPSMAEKFANDNGLFDFIEVSSKEEISIETPFKLLVEQIMGENSMRPVFLRKTTATKVPKIA